MQTHTTPTPELKLGFNISLSKHQRHAWRTYWEWSGRPPSWGKHTGIRSVPRPGYWERPCTPPPQLGYGPPTEASDRQTETRYQKIIHILTQAPHAKYIVCIILFHIWCSLCSLYIYFKFVCNISAHRCHLWHLVIKAEQFSTLVLW